MAALIPPYAVGRRENRPNTLQAVRLNRQLGRGGQTSAQQSTARNGGAGGQEGGAGGKFGGATAGGDGGTIAVPSGRNITLNGDVSADGSAGGDVSATATAGNGGAGTNFGGAGGAILGVGFGGKGGRIDINAKNALTNNNKSVIAANGGPGGTQYGKAGDGGNANTAVVGSIGGDGGNVGAAGRGGGGDTISIAAATKSSDIKESNAPGLSGHQMGTVGKKGDGNNKDAAHDGMTLPG